MSEQLPALEAGQLERPSNPRQCAFLVAYIECGGHKTKACKAAEIGRTTFYLWMNTDANFKKLFDEAHGELCDDLELAARERAIDGWDEPVFYEGVACGSKRKFSDVLLAMLLNGNLPEKYRKQQIEHSGPGGKPIETNSNARLDIQALQSDPEYVEFLRAKHVAADCNPSVICAVHQPTNGHSLANGSAPRDLGSGTNGTGNGRQ